MRRLTHWSLVVSSACIKACNVTANRKDLRRYWKMNPGHVGGSNRKIKTYIIYFS
jgi:hypothetical protein